MRKHSFITIFTALMMACTLPSAVALAQVAAGDAASEAEKEFLSYAVTEKTLPYARLEATANTVTAGSDAFGKNLSLRTFKGQRVKNGGTASEIAIDYPYKEGETVRYSWRMALPGNFGSDATNRWWLMARWSAQPNLKMGERSETFLTLNPAIMLTYKLVEERDVFSLSYGVPDAITADAFSVTRNEWVKIDLEITWSTSNKGKARLFINNSRLPVREISGRNMYGKYHNLFRVGTFRSSAIPTEATISVGDIRAEHIQP